MKTDFKKQRDDDVALAGLAPGTLAIVTGIDTNSGLRRRLLDLGFVPQTPIRVMRRAPLGDPVVYELRGMRICLRGSEARHVRVRVVPGEPR